MAQILVPDSGLTLINHTQSKTENAAAKDDTGLAQVMQLDLPPKVLGDILRSARHGGKGVNLQFGKTIVSRLLNGH